MTVAVLGLGNRGTGYLRILSHFAKDVEINAVCDKIPIKAKETAKKYKAKRTFTNDEDFFASGKLADALIIATQDRDHYGHALMAIECGYKDILMEKPVSPSIEECKELLRLSEEKGVRIVVCHVLRYSKYYSSIKKIIESGEIGDVININHMENIGFFHYAHSYVRGNWHDSNTTSPMIMAKCCHDFDLIHWFVKETCVKLTSYGSLSYFNSNNDKKSYADRCLDCSEKKNCPYDAESLYITAPLHKSTFLKLNGRVLTDKFKGNKQEKYNALRERDYGRCVYRSDNNVVDHQVVNMLFASGATATHTVTAFSDKFFRRTFISGTKGEIIGNDHDGKLHINVFGKKSRTIRTKLIKITGHIDGDINLIKNWVKLVKNELKDDNNVTYLKETIPSHEMVLKAEEERLKSL